jgi:predicted DNA-binding transcriptional regulator AlpA
MPNSESHRELLVDVVHIQPDTAPPSRKDARRANRAQARALAADPLLPAAEAAPETGRALSTFWRDVKRGILPPPYYVTPRAPRWRLSELRAAVQASPRAPRAV